MTTFSPSLLAEVRPLTFHSFFCGFYLGFVFNDYFSSPRWIEEGIPNQEKLVQLAIKECL